MPLPKEVMTMQNYRRWERNLPLEKEVKMIRPPEPEAPKVPDQIRFQDIPDQEIKDFGARSKMHKNKDGARFTGWNFYVEFTNGKKVQGWMGEGEFAKLKARIPRERTDLLSKIAL